MRREKELANQTAYENRVRDEERACQMTELEVQVMEREEMEVSVPPHLRGRKVYLCQTWHIRWSKWLQQINRKMLFKRLMTRLEQDRYKIIHPLFVVAVLKPFSPPFQSLSSGYKMHSSFRSRFACPPFHSASTLFCLFIWLCMMHVSITLWSINIHPRIFRRTTS